jgi:hypothetical protein
MATKKTTSKKTGSKKSRSSKSTEQLRKEALAETQKNIAAIDKAEAGAAPTPEAKPKRGGGKKKGAAKSKSAVEPKPAKEDKALSALDAAALGLKDSKEPLGTKEMIAEMAKRKLWTSSAATPWATLYSAILRELQKMGKEARFVKTERGRFAFAGAAAAGKKGA